MAPIIWLATRSNARSRLASPRRRNGTSFREKKRVNASHTHDLKELVRVAELQSVLRTATKSDPLLLKYWDIVESWSEQSCYGKHSPESAQALIEAVGDRNHGVIKWVKHYW